MTGGLLQLSAVGTEDSHLTGTPQITFFKVVYRKHTNFAIESIKQTINGSTNFGQECHANITKSGHLVHKLYISCKLPSINLSDSLDSTKTRAFRWLNWIGHVLIDYVSLEIGGAEIVKHYGEWLHIFNELSQTGEKASAYAEMVGNVPKLTQIQSSNTNVTFNTEEYELYIPLQFWFCRNPGLAIPINALTSTDMRLNIKFNTLDNCIWATNQSSSSTYVSTKASSAVSTSSGAPSLSDVALYVDYIFLGDDEKNRFKNNDHQYLIEQVQRTTQTISKDETSKNINCNIRYPVKELVWIIQPNKYTNIEYTQSRGGTQWFNYTDAWDYTNFTGTPENYYGPGLVGGRGQQNIFYGLPTVNVKGALNSNNNWAETTTSASITNTTAGYNDVFEYTESSSNNKYENRTMEHLLGPSLDIPNSGNSVGLWNATANDINITDSGKNPIVNATLVLNGSNRFSQRNGFYFNVVQPYQHHTSVPAPGINVYSFSIEPESVHQPSGSCNFSTIDTAYLNLTLTANSTSATNGATFKLYATNYNILNISGGTASLGFS